jgi:hypothetical protein
MTLFVLGPAAEAPDHDYTGDRTILNLPCLRATLDWNLDARRREGRRLAGACSRGLHHEARRGRGILPSANLPAGLLVRIDAEQCSRSTPAD